MMNAVNDFILTSTASKKKQVVGAGKDRSLNVQHILPDVKWSHAYLALSLWVWAETIRMLTLIAREGVTCPRGIVTLLSTDTADNCHHTTPMHGLHTTLASWHWPWKDPCLCLSAQDDNAIKSMDMEYMINIHFNVCSDKFFQWINFQGPKSCFVGPKQKENGNLTTSVKTA